MKLVHAERLGEAFDSQLVIGVRESYGEKASACGGLHDVRFTEKIRLTQVCGCVFENSESLLQP